MLNTVFVVTYTLSYMFFPSKMIQTDILYLIYFCMSSTSSTFATKLCDVKVALSNMLSYKSYSRRPKTAYLLSPGCCYHGVCNLFSLTETRYDFKNGTHAWCITIDVNVFSSKRTKKNKKNTPCDIGSQMKDDEELRRLAKIDSELKREGNPHSHLHNYLRRCHQRSHLEHRVIYTTPNRG